MHNNNKDVSILTHPLVILCAQQDSNLHCVNNQILSLARLPIPPRAHKWVQNYMFFV